MPQATPHQAPAHLLMIMRCTGADTGASKCIAYAPAEERDRCIWKIVFLPMDRLKTARPRASNTSSWPPWRERTCTKLRWYWPHLRIP